MDGKPLSTGLVIFHPDASRGNKAPHEPRSAIDAQGNYDLMTANKLGAPPGWYNVAVVAQKESAEKVNGHTAYVWLIDRKYATHATSGLSVEVVEKPAPEAYDIKIESKSEP